MVLVLRLSDNMSPDFSSDPAIWHRSFLTPKDVLSSKVKWYHTEAQPLIGVVLAKYGFCLCKPNPLIGVVSQDGCFGYWLAIDPAEIMVMASVLNRPVSP